MPLNLQIFTVVSLHDKAFHNFNFLPVPFQYLKVHNRSKKTAPEAPLCSPNASWAPWGLSARVAAAAARRTRPLGPRTQIAQRNGRRQSPRRSGAAQARPASAQRSSKPWQTTPRNLGGQSMPSGNFCVVVVADGAGPRLMSLAMSLTCNTMRDPRACKLSSGPLLFSSPCVKTCGPSSFSSPCCAKGLRGL